MARSHLHYVQGHMDEGLKKAAIEGDVAFLREAVASGKPLEYFGLKYFPRHPRKEEVGGNIFHLAAANQRVEFIREALEILPFMDAHELLIGSNIEWKSLLDKDFILGNEELVRVVEDFYERRNPMDRHLKDAAVNGDANFLTQAFSSGKPLECFKSNYYTCPTREGKEQGGNNLHLAAYHGRVDFFKAAMELFPISELDILLWPKDFFYVSAVLEIARRPDDNINRQEIACLIEGIYTSRNTMDEQLKEAAIRGDVEFLKQAVASGKPLDYFHSLYCVPNPYYDEQVGNIFHLAIHNRRVEFVAEAIKILFEAGVDVHFLIMSQQNHPSSNSKQTPLLLAVRKKYKRIVKHILDNTSLAVSTQSGVNPWLIQDKYGCSAFFYILNGYPEKWALRLLSIHPELLSHMDAHTGDIDCSPLICALSKCMNEVVLKFWESNPNWHTFDKRVLVRALCYAPCCSDKVFKLVLEQNLQVIKDRDYYRVWSPVRMWTSIGKLYPFDCVLKDELRAPDLRRYLIDLMSQEFSEYTVGRGAHDEDKAIEIASMLIDIYQKERRDELNSAKIEPPWFARNVLHGSLLRQAIETQYEKLALWFLSLEKIELLLREDSQLLFLAIKHRCRDVADKILDLIDQHSLETLLTSSTDRTVLHDAPKVTGDFLKKLLKRYPQLLTQSDEDGFTVLHSWMEIGKLWPFQFILKKEEFDHKIRFDFKRLIYSKTESGRTPLHVAASVSARANGAIESIVQFLFDASREEHMIFKIYVTLSEKDIEGKTPIDIALSERREELTLCFLSDRRFFESGFQANEILFKAIDRKCHLVVKFLLDTIHRHDYLRNNGRQSVLHIASEFPVENARVIVEKWPELITKKDEDGKTPLERASAAGADWLVELILLKNRSCILTTPLAWVEACERGHLSTVVTFMKKSKYFRHICRKYHDTPLHHIKLDDYNQYEELLKIPLIQELKDTQDKSGDTPLHKAIQENNKDLAEILLTVGEVGWNIKNNDGKSAVDLLAQACQDPEWKELCEAIEVDPRKRISYISRKTDLTQMREVISLVAALLATITFTAGFTVPGGFSSTGEAVLTRKAAFVVFVITDTYAMCCSMLILFSVIWSMVCSPNKASFLADRSLSLLKQSLYGTLLAFMTGVYVAIHKKSLATSIVVLIMSSATVILAQRRVMYSLFDLLNFMAITWNKAQLYLAKCWENLASCVERLGHANTPAEAAPAAQNQSAETRNASTSDAV